MILPNNRFACEDGAESFVGKIMIAACVFICHLA